MKKIKGKNNQSKEELEEKKTTKKALIILIPCIAIGVFLVLFMGEYFAKESIITKSHIINNGNDLTITFSEKGSNISSKNADGERQRNMTHYGYYLELFDNATQKSLSKLKFAAPVSTIQVAPEMIINTNKDIWIISTTNSIRKDENGFIFKFSIADNKITDTGFTLDEKYCLSQIRENKLYLGEGNGVHRVAHYDPNFGNIYLDLETGKIEDNRRTNEELSKH